MHEKKTKKSKIEYCKTEQKLYKCNVIKIVFSLVYTAYVSEVEWHGKHNILIV